MNAIDVGERAAIQYDRMADRLTAEARDADASGRPMTARRMRYQARLARHAAEQERANPEPPDIRTRIVVPDTLVASPASLCTTGHDMRLAPGGTACIRCDYRVMDGRE